MLEVVLETSTLSMDPQTLRHLVKTRLKDSLAVNLAGQVSLDRFRRLSPRWMSGSRCITP